jgi:hypothetical protein
VYFYGEQSIVSTVYSKLKGSTISRIPPSFAFFQTIENLCLPAQLLLMLKKILMHQKQYIAPPSVEYCQVSPSFKPSTVIVLLLVMPSLSDKPVSYGTQIVYFYGEQSIVSTESSAVSTEDDKQSFLNVIASNVGIVAIVVDNVRAHKSES